MHLTPRGVYSYGIYDPEVMTSLPPEERPDTLSASTTPTHLDLRWYEWAGSAHASESREIDIFNVVRRRNKCINPSFEKSGNTGWTNIGALIKTLDGLPSPLWNGAHSVRINPANNAIYTWAGTGNSSESIEAIDGLETRRNLATRPIPTAGGGWVSTDEDAWPVAVVNGEGRGGRRALVATRGAESAGDVLAEVNAVGVPSTVVGSGILVDGGSTYTYSVYAKSTKNPWTAQFTLSYFNSDSDPVGDPVLPEVADHTPDSDGWVRLVATDQAPVGAERVVLKVTISAEDDIAEEEDMVWLSDAMVEAEADDILYSWEDEPQASPSLEKDADGNTLRVNLANSPIPADDSGGWVSVYDFIERTFAEGEGRNGRDSMRYEVTPNPGIGEGEGEGEFGVPEDESENSYIAWVRSIGATADTYEENVPVNPNVTYTISVYARTNVANWTGRIDISWADEEGTLIDGVSLGTPESGDTGGEWTRFTRTVVAPDGAAFLRADIGVVAPDGAFEGDVAWLTDVQIEASNAATEFFDGDTLNKVVLANGPTPFFAGSTTNVSIQTSIGMRMNRQAKVVNGETVRGSLWAWIPENHKVTVSYDGLYPQNIEGSDSWVEFKLPPITFSTGMAGTSALRVVMQRLDGEPISTSSYFLLDNVLYETAAPGYTLPTVRTYFDGDTSGAESE